MRLIVDDQEHDILVGSTLAPMCKSRYLVHFVAVDVKSTYENDRGSSLLSAEVCETGENVREVLRVAM